MSFTSDLIHPSSPSSTSTSQLPSGLITFVSSSDRKTYAVWTEETSETFCSWFATTKWYQNAQADGATYSLPSWTSSTKTAKELWTNFNQIALVPTGEAKVMCLICDKILSHPATKNQGGTSTMRHHLQRNECLKAQKRNSIMRGTQRTVVQMVLAKTKKNDVEVIPYT